MSTNQQPQLPSTDEALNLVFNQVHQRVFFNKLAAAGVSITSQQEAQDYLTLAGNLRMCQDNPAVKAAAASDEGNLAGKMNDALEGVLQKLGVSSHSRQSAEKAADEQRRQWAQQLSQDPGMYNAVLSLKIAEANAVQQYLQSQNNEGAAA